VDSPLVPARSCSAVDVMAQAAGQGWGTCARYHRRPTAVLDGPAPEQSMQPPVGLDGDPGFRSQQSMRLRWRRSRTGRRGSSYAEAVAVVLPAPARWTESPSRACRKERGDSRRRAALHSGRPPHRAPKPSRTARGPKAEAEGLRSHGQTFPPKRRKRKEGIDRNTRRPAPRAGHERPRRWCRAGEGQGRARRPPRREHPEEARLAAVPWAVSTKPGFHVPRSPRSARPGCAAASNKAVRAASWRWPSRERPAACARRRSTRCRPGCRRASHLSGAAAKSNQAPWPPAWLTRSSAGPPKVLLPSTTRGITRRHRHVDPPARSRSARRGRGRRRSR